MQKEFSSKSSATESKVSDLSKQLDISKVECAAQKAKSDKTLRDLQSTHEQLKKSYTALQKDYGNVKSDIDTHKAQCNSAKEDAKKHMATAKEVILMVMLKKFKSLFLVVFGEYGSSLLMFRICAAQLWKHS